MRNFGHGIVSAMAQGEAFNCALTARERWLELGARGGFEVLECGSLLVARHEDELAAMEGVAADEQRGGVMLTPAEVGELAPIDTREVVGGLHARLDIRVDPRQAVAALATLLEVDAQAEIVWGAPVASIDPGITHASSVSVSAPIAIVCPGPAYRSLPAELAPHRDGLTMCSLQMLRVAAPEGRRYEPALLTGLSLLRYPGYSLQPGVERVRARIARERPVLIAAGVHLIVTQLPGGDLIIGDTHAYGDTVSPFRDERLDRLLLEEASRLLGAHSLEVRERWLGVYPAAPGHPFLVDERAPGVWLVEVVSGIGMTTALGLAERVLDSAVGGVRTRPGGRPSQRHGAPLQTEEARAGYGS